MYLKHKKLPKPINCVMTKRTLLEAINKLVVSLAKATGT